MLKRPACSDAETVAQPAEEQRRAAAVTPPNKNAVAQPATEPGAKRAKPTTEISARTVAGTSTKCEQTEATQSVAAPAFTEPVSYDEESEQIWADTLNEQHCSVELDPVFGLWDTWSDDDCQRARSQRRDGCAATPSFLLSVNLC